MKYEAGKLAQMFLKDLNDRYLTKKQAEWLLDTLRKEGHQGTMGANWHSETWTFNDYVNIYSFKDSRLMILKKIEAHC